MRILNTILATRAAVLASALCLVDAISPRALAAQQDSTSSATQQGQPKGPLAVDSVTSTLGATLRPRPVLTSRDVFVTTAFVLGAAALMPADAGIARELQRSGPQSSPVLRGFADGIESVASPGALVFGGSLYVAGIVARKRQVADFGWHTLEALIVSDQVTTALKGLFGRTRPYAANGDAQDFDFAGGFSSSVRRSFPSGHTSMAFAFASVVAEESAIRWPGAHRIIAPLSYAAATGVGLARMYNDKHWASDVALGAAIGTLAGRFVVRYAHGRPDNWLDRVALWAAGR